VVLGFDDDGGDGERGEKGKGVSCEWTRSCLERCLVLVRDGQGILSGCCCVLMMRYRCLEFLSTVRSDAYLVCYWEPGENVAVTGLSRECFIRQQGIFTHTL
jgi:hypothetical protein